MRARACMCVYGDVCVCARTLDRLRLLESRPPRGLPISTSDFGDYGHVLPRTTPEQFLLLKGFLSGLSARPGFTHG